MTNVHKYISGTYLVPSSKVTILNLKVEILLLQH